MTSHPPIYRSGHDTPLFPHVREARSVWAQSIGLMFRRHIDYVLLFHFRSPPLGITNLFVFHTIDLIFLDAAKRVIAIRHAFRPFTPFYRPPPDTAYLIEIPSAVSPHLSPDEQLVF